MTTVRHDILSAEEQIRRREILHDALVQVCLEGLEPDPLFFDYAERYSCGEITLAEAIEDYGRRIGTSLREA